MNPYRARCAYCGHIYYGYSRKSAYDYMIRHCHETENHPIIEPYLRAIPTTRYWLWRSIKDKGRLEQIERQAIPLAMERLRNIP